MPEATTTPSALHLTALAPSDMLRTGKTPSRSQLEMLTPSPGRCICTPRLIRSESHLLHSCARACAFLCTSVLPAAGMINGFKIWHMQAFQICRSTCTSTCLYTCGACARLMAAGAAQAPLSLSCRWAGQ